MELANALVLDWTELKIHAVFSHLSLAPDSPESDVV
jgi:hypothetical protein